MKTLYLALLTLLIVSCNQAQEEISPSAILISDVHIVDVRSGNIIENQQVVIDSAQIRSITETTENKEAYSQNIDGTGKYLMPGLAEMHAHIPPPCSYIYQTA